MNDQIIRDNFHRVEKIILNMDERLDILATVLADLQRKFNDHQHPVIENTDLEAVVSVALTGPPVPEPDKQGEPA